MRAIVDDVTPYFDLPKSPAAEAVRVFLDGLQRALEEEALLTLSEAAE